jgi:long-chain acyl-CoA synthetase
MAKNVAELFFSRVASTPDREAFASPNDDGTWNWLTWTEVGERVRAIAGGLRALGLENEDRCAIASNTRLEWILIDLGILCAGGATSTIYPSSTADEAAFILKDSAAKVAFVENAEQLKKMLDKRSELPALKHCVVIDAGPKTDDFVITLEELEKRGKKWNAEHAGELERISKQLKPESLATLIYTSGTTGVPKGVELTHDNWVYEGEAIQKLGILLESDTQFLWLPLAHSFGKVLEVAQLTIGFATAVDGRVDKIVDNLGTVKPTFVAAVPRIFEKVHARIVSGVKEEGGLKLSIFEWAFRVGRECSALVQRGEEPGGWLGFKRSIAQKLVFSKMQARFGGRLRFFVSGSAPLSRELAEFFHAAGILILEGYGLTESSAASFVNLPEKYRFGTVGPALPGTQVKLADDGEILIKGRGIMRGYHGLAEATAEALDDGWLKTGDIGEIQDGFLKITDRKKDLIKTAGGKYVAPQMIEGKIKAASPAVSQVVVHGDRRKFVSALIAYDPEALAKWGKEHGYDGGYEELAKRPEAHAFLEPVVKQVNESLPSYATVKKFAVLPADLTLESGDLTTSLKLKRKAVEKKYATLLDSLYQGGGGD